MPNIMDKLNCQAPGAFCLYCWQQDFRITRHWKLLLSGKAIMRTPSLETLLCGIRQHITCKDELLAEAEKFLIPIILAFSGNAQ
jgi:hypothetical protein